MVLVQYSAKRKMGPEERNLQSTNLHPLGADTHNEYLEPTHQISHVGYKLNCLSIPT